MTRVLTLISAAPSWILWAATAFLGLLFTLLRWGERRQ